MLSANFKWPITIPIISSAQLIYTTINSARWRTSRLTMFYRKLLTPDAIIMRFQRIFCVSGCPRYCMMTRATAERYPPPRRDKHKHTYTHTFRGLYAELMAGQIA